MQRMRGRAGPDRRALHDRRPDRLHGVLGQGFGRIDIVVVGRFLDAALQGVDPHAVAIKLVILLGSAGNDYESWRARGYSDELLIETTARLLHLIATGRGPPAEV